MGVSSHPSPYAGTLLKLGYTEYISDSPRLLGSVWGVPPSLSGYAHWPGWREECMAQGKRELLTGYRPLLFSSPNGKTETQQELTCLRSLGQGGDRLEGVHTQIFAAEIPRLLLPL